MKLIMMKELTTPEKLPVPNEEPMEGTRRNFTAAYKLRILQEADACTQLKRIVRLLRKITDWRRALDKGLFQSPQKRGRKHKETNPLTAKVALLQKEILIFICDSITHNICPVQGFPWQSYLRLPLEITEKHLTRHTCLI